MSMVFFPEQLKKMMNAFTLLFLMALAVSFGLEWWLMRRQIAHVRGHRDTVPEPFRASITLDVHQKAADYTVDKARVSEAERLISLALLLILTLGGGIDYLNKLWISFELTPWIAAIGTLLTTLLLMQLVDIPLGYYRTFGVEQKYGFNRSSPGQFLTDLALQTGLSLAIGIPLLTVVLWIMDHIDHWWFWAWAVVMGFTLLMSWAYPTFIAPLFNQFSPLADDALRERIESLLQRCGFHSQGIFVMDGSKRSSHGNAYFTGVGESKRIVFFDTLINTLEPDEIEAVLAHELGHFKCHHVIKMLVVTASLSLAGFVLLGWLSDQTWFYQGLGVGQGSHALALLLFMLVAPVFSSFLQPAMAWFQRRHEFEADAFASTHARPEQLVSALVKLYRDNASTLTPDPLYSAFHYSHPPAAVRIAHLNAQKTS